MKKENFFKKAENWDPANGGYVSADPRQRFKLLSHGYDASRNPGHFKACYWLMVDRKTGDMQTVSSFTAGRELVQKIVDAEEAAALPARMKVNTAPKKIRVIAGVRMVPHAGYGTFA